MLGLSDLNSFSMSGKDASLKENVLSFATLHCVNKMLGWFLNLSIALLTGSVMSLLLSTMYVLFSVIPRSFVAFLKRLFISSATSLSLGSMSSFSFTSVILLTLFRFSEKKGWMFFQNVLLSVILRESMLSKKQKKTLLLWPCYTVFRLLFIYLFFLS